MPSSHYLSSALWYDRLSQFYLMLFGHMASYAGRGTFTATEQIPIYGDANGYYRDYLWDYLEGGIDECVPSIMLSSVAALQSLTIERFDQDTVFVGRAAPHRWALTGITAMYCRYYCCVRALKGLMCESLRRDHPGGLTSPAFYACGSARPLSARCCHSSQKNCLCCCCKRVLCNAAQASLSTT
jgi:hypothetical protein